MRMNYDDVRLRIRVGVMLWSALTLFIAAIWFMAAYIHGPYHPGPRQVCLKAHDVYYYSHYYQEEKTKQVCDDYGQIWPGGGTPTPDPSISAVYDSKAGQK